MGLRIRHPDVANEGEAVDLDQFHAVHEPRGWELVPDGTPHPDEIAAQPLLDQVAEFTAATEGGQPEQVPVERPVVNDSKADWVTYAVSQGFDADEADAMTKVALIDALGPNDEAATDAANDEAADAPAASEETPPS